MGISETQFDTWSRQGSVTQSASTYASIKATLEAANSRYADKNFEVFLQGSYGNDTNIYKESDVDIVIRLDSSFTHTLSQLPANQEQLFKSNSTNATYDLNNFKSDVLATLRAAYGSDVVEGEKAIQIAARNNRRKTDVVVAILHRKYLKYAGEYDQNFISGIEFQTRSGMRIINYPKLHSQNLTNKHQATSNWLKPVIRIYKNMRSRMVDEGIIASDTAPSYFVEGLIYNVPTGQFGTNYANSFVNSLNWLLKADRTDFVCVNEQYYLLREDSPVTWRASKCETFLNGLVKLWNN